jgi:3-phenylpropionate/trans-cinnamate dioxygenase ferredoxin subunit
MFNYKEIDSTDCEFIPVAEVEDLPIGERLFLEIDNKPIVVINIAGGLFAIGDVCSHDDGPVGEGEIEGNEIICPRHGARFDLRSGEAVGLPAVVDIPAYPVRVVGGQIEIGLPAEQQMKGT